ncbi:hypothetical protein EU545_04110, partial [Candidatus Thorarchaeota archaeon]
MDSTDRRSMSLLVVILVAAVLLSMLWSLSNTDFTEVNPLFGLPNQYHFLLITYLIPVLGSIITAVVFPRVLAPLFLSLKGTVMRGYSNAQIEVSHRRLRLKRWLSRAVLTSLLILGFITAIVNIIEPNLFMSPGEYNDFLVETGFPQYAPPVMISLSGFIAPIAFGLWAVSWVLEDSGIIHYDLPSAGANEYYEVEPVYRRYAGYLKGYSGLSSILFIGSVFLLFLQSGGMLESAAFTLLIPLFSVIQTIPGYLVYSQIGTSFLTRGL